MPFTKIRKMAYAGIFIAVSIVLTRFFSRILPIAGVGALRLSFGEIPLLLSGLMLGPWFGAASGALADLLGYPLLPQGPYFPGFTLSSALIGFVPGLLARLRKGPWTWPALLAVIAPTIVLTSLVLNTLWLNMLFDRAFAVLLPPRILANLILIPIYATIVHVVMKQLKHLRR